MNKQPAVVQRWTTHSPFSPRFELRMMPVMLGLLLDLAGKRIAKARRAKLQAKLRTCHGIAVDLHAIASGQTRVAMAHVAHCLSPFAGDNGTTDINATFHEFMARPSVKDEIVYARNAIQSAIDAEDVRLASGESKVDVPAGPAFYQMSQAQLAEQVGSAKTIQAWARKANVKPRRSQGHRYTVTEIRAILRWGADHGKGASKAAAVKILGREAE